MIIKNRILTMVLAISLSGLISNQVLAQYDKRAGIKGGLNVSNLYIDHVNDENARLGFHVGFFGEFLSSESFGLQAELLYSTKGSKNFYSQPANQEVRYNLNYIDIPLMALFKLGAIDIHIGGYGSYLVNANITYNGDVVNGQEEIDKDNLKSYDFGLLGGVGVNFGGLQIGARYNYGLVEIADSPSAYQLLGNSKNSVAQLYLAINMNHK